MLREENCKRKKCHSLKISTHTFLLVKLRCGKQDKEQHGKAVRQSKGQSFGFLRARGEVNVKPSVEREDKAKQKKGKEKRLTLSLDYSEWEGDDQKQNKKKKRGVGKQHREEWADGNLRATWKQNNIYSVGLS